MVIHPIHSWNLSPSEAVKLQSQLAARVETGPPLTHWKLIAGADVSYNRFSSWHYAAVVVLSVPGMEVVETRAAVGEVEFPYVPGLLSFREAPVLLEALRHVEARPDVVVLDGQGIAHPRRLGLASHVGLFLEVPCVGCAKSRLTGKYEEPGPKAGATAPLTDRGEVIGTVVRTKDRVNPVFVSPGNRIDLASAVRVVLDSCRGYRLPEPARRAHLQVNEVRIASSVREP